MDKTEFIGKLQLCYVGDRNAFDEIVGEYDRLNNIINKTNWWLKEMLKQAKTDETKAIINGALELLIKDGNK